MAGIRGGPARKTILLGLARGALGYGGLIHDLKNFVLRGDPHRLVDAQRALLELRVVTTGYRSAGVTPEEEAALADLEAVLEQYRAAIATAELLAVQGAGPAELDAAITVDDGPAFDALRRLDRAVISGRNASVDAVNRHVVTLSSIAVAGAVGAGLFFVILAAGFGWYVRRRLVMPISALAAAFQAIDPAVSIDQRLPLRQTRWPNELDDLAQDGNKLLDAYSEQFGERQRADFALAASESRVRAIVEQTAEGIVAIDARGLIESFNPAAETMFGYSAEEVIGQNVSLLSPAGERRAHEEFVSNSELHAPRIINLTRDLIGARKDGSSFPLELDVAPMEVEGVGKFVGVMRDISERKAME